MHVPLPLPPIPATLLDIERVPIRISYNGGFWRAHTVSVGFLRRLNRYLAAHPKLDTIWEFV